MHSGFETTHFQPCFRKIEQKNATIWSVLSNKAYQDCLEDDFKTIFDKTLNTNIRLVTPEMILDMQKIA